MANEFVARKGLIVPSGGMSFSGSFMPNGLGGTAGYVLTSSGLASTPYWNASSGPISITPGAVVFGSTSSGIGEDASKFFWDDTSNCLSIGTSSATGSLHVVGNTIIREGTLRLATDWPAGTSIQLYSPNLPSYSNWIWLNRVNGAGMAIYCGDTSTYYFYIGANGSFRLGGSAYQYGHIISDTGGRVLIGNVDINGTPNTSAIFELRGTLGFLPPRLTSTQKFAISGPTAGLEVYDSTLNQKSIYNGTTWSSTAGNSYGYYTNQSFPRAFVALGASGSNDIYTVPTGKKCLFIDITVTNNSASSISFFPEVKIGGIYYRIGTSVSESVAGTGHNYSMGSGRNSQPIILNADEVISVNCSAPDLTIWLNIVVFDSSSPLCRAGLTAFSNGDNTLFQVPSNRTATLGVPQISSSNQPALSLNSIAYFNNSGGTLTLNGINIVQSGATPSSSNLFATTNSIFNPAGFTKYFSGTLGPSDSISLNVNSATAGQFAWCTYVLGDL